MKLQEQPIDVITLQDTEIKRGIKIRKLKPVTDRKITYGKRLIYCSTQTF